MPTRRLTRGERITLLLIPVVLSLPVYLDIAHARAENDFGTFYRAACEGPLYGDLTLRDDVGYPNLMPPHGHLLVQPLCAWSLRTSYYVWLIATGCCLAWGIYLSETLRRSQWPWWSIPAAAGSTITTSTIFTGQVTGLLAVPLWLAWRADRSGRAWQAGLWFGLVVIAKPFLGLIALWWLWRRAWRALGGAALTAAASLSLGVAAYGLDSQWQWIRQLQSVSWTSVTMNASVWGAWMRTFSRSHLSPSPIVDAPLAATIGAALSMTAILVLTARAIQRATIDRGWTLCVTAGLLTSPLGWIYYGWWLLPMSMMTPLPRWAWTVALVITIVPMPLFWMLPITPWTTASVGNLYCVAVLALWAGALRVAPDAARLQPGRRESQPSPAPPHRNATRARDLVAQAR